MRDPEEYPKHQPGRGEQEHHDPFARDVQEEGELENQPRRHERGPVHQRDAASMPQLPRHHGKKAVIIGLIAGALASAQGLIIILVNSGTYQEAAKQIQGKQASNLSLGLAELIFGLACLSVFISAVIYLISGFITGKVSVHRRWAFIGGFIGGLLSAAIGDIAKQVPGYPDASTTGFSGGVLGFGGGITALLISALILGVLAGAVSLLGAWLATRRHPYYVGYSG